MKFMISGSFRKFPEDIERCMTNTVINAISEASTFIRLNILGAKVFSVSSIPGNKLISIKCN